MMARISVKILQTTMKVLFGKKKKYFDRRWMV